jgi:eukaryotic-like serine/threonine-protein kinase
MTVETNILPPRYRDPQLIGYGGMGEIYRAEDVALSRSVAVKVLAERYAQDESVRGRFTREALTAARLSGEPSTITIFDVGEHEQRPFIVMEYLDGGSLEDRLRQSGAQDPRQALEWLEQAAAALDAAHRNGVVHRDVKPGNLLLAADGTVRVADFGVASAAGLDSLTVTGTVLGTAGYLAPEQAKGEPTTSATDRYALGVVAFELLTGQRPYQSDAPTAEAAAHVHAEIPSASERVGLPAEVDSVFRRALAKAPDERYGSSSEFVAALRDALAPAGLSTRELAPVAAPPSRTGVRRGGANRLLVGAAVLATLAVAGAGLAALLTDGDSRGETVVTQVLTRTLPGTTETVATTVQATTATTGTTAPEPPPPPPATGDGVALTDEATALLQQGRWAEAESVAGRAVAALEGSGNQRYLAYALYDLGRAQAEQGKCEAALPNLDRSEDLQGHRTDIDRARAKCGVR